MTETVFAGAALNVTGSTTLTLPLSGSVTWTSPTDTSGPPACTPTSSVSHADPLSSSVRQTRTVKVPAAAYVCVPGTAPPFAGTELSTRPSPQSMVAA